MIKNIFYGAVVFLVFVLAVVFGFVIMIYGFGLDNSATRTFAKLVPAPAAVVGGRVITLQETYQGNLDDLIDREVMAAAAADRAVAIDELPVLILSDKNSAGHKRAAAVLQKLQAGGDFAALAAEASDDWESKYIGGDLGILSLSEVNPWLRAAAMNLPVGAASGILVSPDGYHILLVAKRWPAEEKAHFYQIYIRDDSWRDYLAAARARTQIYVFQKFRQPRGN